MLSLLLILYSSSNMLVQQAFSIPKEPLEYCKLHPKSLICPGSPGYCKLHPQDLSCVPGSPAYCKLHPTNRYSCPAYSPFWNLEKCKLHPSASGCWCVLHRNDPSCPGSPAYCKLYPNSAHCTSRYAF